MKFKFTEYQDLATGGYKDCDLTLDAGDQEAYFDGGTFFHSSVGERYQMDAKDDKGNEYIIAWILKDEDEDPEYLDWKNPTMLLKRA